MTRRRTAALAAGVAMALAAAAHTEPLPEPPVDADAAADYAAEPDDSTASGVLAVGYGLVSRSGRSPGRNRSLRFRGDSLEAGLRDGDGDPYDGGDVQARARGRVLRVGRIAPAWGRGLAVGAPVDPWIARAGEEFDPFATRARGGDGVSCRWPGRGFDVFGGRIGGRAAAGLGLERYGVRVGAAGARGAPAAVSASHDGDGRALEWAADGAGRWRAEAAAARGAGGLEVALRLGAGHERYRPPLGPVRSTPARVAAAALRGGADAWRWRAAFAGWRYAAGAAGTRAGLELERHDARAGTWSWGFEEQHGARREPGAGAYRAAGMRQGAWLEWRGEARGMTLSVRDEWWGKRAFARERTREALGAAVQAELPAGARLGLAHTAYRARTGETVYLPERDSDRWVLRALSGSGARTRATLTLPLAEGDLGGAIALGNSRGRVRTQWSLQWSRRIRLRGS